MKSKKHILLILLLIGFSTIIIYRYNKKINITSIKPKTEVQATELSSIFLQDEKKASKFYNGSVIKVTGIVKEISLINNVTTIILLGKGENSSIFCEMDTDLLESKLPMRNDTIELKGICKGFLKDVVIQNCQLIKQ